MSDPYLGEIRLFAGNFAPLGWLFCNGSLQQISENDALFQLIGTTYGGDGVVTFGMPDLTGRVPVHIGTGYTMGQLGGAESVTLTEANLPQHTHAMQVSTLSASAAYNASTGLPGNTGGSNLYGPVGAIGAMRTGLVGPGGGNGLPHDNMAPYMGINFIIATSGIFPSQA